MEIHPLILAALYGLAGFGWWAACDSDPNEGIAAVIYAVFWPITAIIALVWCLAVAGLRAWQRAVARRGGRS
tara:strand:- start:335 stop:550 length:216 start_codon:yes stop_codon:yes gene_type:complete